MISLIQSEWYKLRKSKISWGIILFGPIVSFLFALMLNFDFETTILEVNLWEIYFSSILVFYGVYFLPIISGVLAAMICRHEHLAGGWKQLLSLPLTRTKVFLAKYILLSGIIFVIQILFLSAVYFAGLINGISADFPLFVVLKSVIWGWVATLPLAALQLWMSILFRHFAASFTINVIFSVPAILAVNSEKFGPLYPWAQPFLLMYNSFSSSGDYFIVPWEQVTKTVGISFIIFFLGGLIYFNRKEIA